jgi:hypothetical protein
MGANLIWNASLPSGPSKERTPFRFLECDVQGGDANQIKGADWTVTLNLTSPYPNPELQIKDADAALAWMFSQLPYVSGKSPNEIVSISWPTNMEAQDLFPSTSSTYTFPTGTKVDVPCFAQNKEVDIKRTECPDLFVNPMDLNDSRACVKVLHGSIRCLHP